MLWLTLVVALVVGWWIDRSRLAPRLDRVEEALKLVKYIVDQKAEIRKRSASSPAQIQELENDMDTMIRDILEELDK